MFVFLTLCVNTGWWKLFSGKLINIKEKFRILLLGINFIVKVVNAKGIEIKIKMYLVYRKTCNKIFAHIKQFLDNNNCGEWLDELLFQTNKDNRKFYRFVLWKSNVL